MLLLHKELVRANNMLIGREEGHKRVIDFKNRKIAFLKRQLMKRTRHSMSVKNETQKKKILKTQKMKTPKPQKIQKAQLYIKSFF